MTKENLNWIRIFDPTLIPSEYIDQIKKKEFTTDKFYEFQKDICLIENEFGLILNPYNLLYVLADSQASIKGFLWMVIDALSNSLVINTFSVDKEFWGNGSAVKLLIDKAIEIKDKENLERIYWITRSPKHSEKFGFKRSKNVLMEYANGEHSKIDEGSFTTGVEQHLERSGCEIRGKCTTDDEGTTEVSKERSE